MLDVRYVDIRGPVTSNRQSYVRGARMFVYNDRLYIAESRDRGATVAQVTAYDVPEGQPTLKGRAGSWGPWSWTSCGCSNQWSRQQIPDLAAKAETVNA